MPGYRKTAARLWLGTSSAAVGLFAVYSLHHFGGSLGEELFGRWLNAAIGVMPGSFCLWRAATRRRERLPWLLIGCGATAWGLGGVYYLTAYFHADSVPFPSPADIGYLAVYPFLYPGLLLLVRSRLAGLRKSLWLDGVIGGLAVASLATAVVFEVVLHGVGGSAAAVATNLAYPLGDAVLIALVVLVYGMHGWRPGRDWGLIGLGLAVFFVGDSVYLVQTAQGTYAAGHLLDASWPLGLLLVAFAAARPTPERRSAAADGRIVLVMPISFIVAMIGLVLFDHVHRLNTLAIVLTTLTLLAGVGRLALTFGENMSMLDHSRVEARTDQLTLLGNRRRLLTDLDSVFHSGARRLLVLLDLNGFKHYNDSFGHQAGDALLTRLGGALAAVVAAHGTAYRLGGDEFCALMDVDDEAPSLESIAHALSEKGDGFEISAAYGTVVIPDEASEVSDALRLADQHMYANKQTGRLSAAEQSRSVLMRVLAERQPDLTSHMERVSELAVAVAGRMGLPRETVNEIRVAAELHDIGKVAIPEAILQRPGPLGPDEVAFVRAHTTIGERIMLGAPALGAAARLVRSSHERIDGTGYPDRLAGDAIPLGSRIIFVCDAFDAITAGRPYAPARTVAEALQELTACTATQFDPGVVAALQAELEAAGASLAA
jgi:two-component system, cell cycle response regulator